MDQLSIPTANLVIDEANSVENTSPGSAMTVDVVVNNGRLNVSDLDLEVYFQ